MIRDGSIRIANRAKVQGDGGETIYRCVLFQLRHMTASAWPSCCSHESEHHALERASIEASIEAWSHTIRLFFCFLFFLFFFLPCVGSIGGWPRTISGSRLSITSRSQISMCCWKVPIATQLPFCTGAVAAALLEVEVACAEDWPGK